MVRMIRLAVVATVLFWSRREIADAELEPCIVRRCAETLLPFATSAGALVLRTEARNAALRMAGPEVIVQDL